MIRSTTNGTLKAYNFNLQRSTYTKNKAAETVLTGRSFNSFAEDPAKASRCFQLRRTFLRANSQYNINVSVSRKFDVAWATLDGVVGEVDNMKETSSLSSIVEAADDTTGGGRNALGIELEQTAKNIIQSMNGKFGDNFVFAGADGLEVPFTWEEDNAGTEVLCYRGINVNADAGSDNYDKLVYLVTEETKFADLGMGMQVGADGKVIDSSAYNVALQGIDFLGYGTSTVTRDDGSTSDPVPNNVVSIIYEMGQILQRCDADSGTWASDDDKTRFRDLFLAFEDSADNLSQKHVELDTRATFLQTNQGQLEDSMYAIQEQLDSFERVDEAEAITAYSWAQYSYNAALKVGNSVLSESLMDYLNF